MWCLDNKVVKGPCIVNNLLWWQLRIKNSPPIQNQPRRMLPKVTNKKKNDTKRLHSKTTGIICHSHRHVISTIKGSKMTFPSTLQPRKLGEEEIVCSFTNWQRNIRYCLNQNEANTPYLLTTSADFTAKIDTNQHNQRLPRRWGWYNW